MESVFESRDLSEAKIERRACSEFTDYATTWWGKILLGRKIYEKNPIVT